MKTLFTNTRAFAVFNCSLNNQTTALRLHIYTKDQNKWVYANNFVIEEKGIQLENIVTLDAANDFLRIETNIKGKKTEHRFDLSNNTCTIKVIKNNKPPTTTNGFFPLLKINDFTLKLNTIFKMPQLISLS